MIKDRTGEYVFQLFKDGFYYGDRSLNCGEKTAKDAMAQWKRDGFTVKTLREPKKES